MRRSLALVLLSATLLTGCATAQAAAFRPTQRPAIPNPPHPQLGIWIGGDSITFGRSATTYATSYRSQVVAYEQARQGSRITVSLEYQPDDLTQYGATWHSSWRTADLLKAAQANPPTSITRFIILAIGTGDSGFTGSTPTPLPEFTTEYETLVELLQAAAPTASFICVGPWMASAATAPYEAVIQSLCPGGQFVDISPLYDNSAVYKGPAGQPETWLGGYVTDDVHPNDLAMQKIAEGIEAYL